jgi:hypothetical protein
MATEAQGWLGAGLAFERRRGGEGRGQARDTAAQAVAAQVWIVKEHSRAAHMLLQGRGIRMTDSTQISALTWSSGSS